MSLLPIYEKIYWEKKNASLFFFRSHMNIVRTTWSIRRSQIVFAVFTITQKLTVTLANSLRHLKAKNLSFQMPQTSHQ